MSKILLKNCNLIDGVSSEISEGMNIIIIDEKIESVFKEGDSNIKGYKIIDCTDKYVLPGLIDAHVHLVWDSSSDPQSVIKNYNDEEMSLAAYKHALDNLRLGITAVRDLGSPRKTVLNVRNFINKEKLVGPTIVASGAPIVMTGGHVSNLGYESDGIYEVTKNTRKLFKEGTDLIKVMATGGIYTLGEEPGSVQLDVEELAAVKREANKKDKKIAAHADGLEGIMNCLEVGVDTIEHGIFADRNALEIMKRQGTYLIPTIQVMRQLTSSEEIPKWALEKAKKILEPHFNMLQDAIDIGVKIVTGTDSGSPLTPPECYFQELLAMKEAGMSEMDVIISSTSLAAECLGLEYEGSIKEGNFADILIVNENPLDNLLSLGADKDVYKRGKLVL